MRILKLASLRSTLARTMFARVLAMGLAGNPAFAALVITPTYDASVAVNFGANTANFMTAFGVAASNFTNVYADNIHVNILVKAVAGTGILGKSESFIGSLGYTTLRDALFGDRTSVDDTTATGAGGSVPSTSADPIVGTHTYWVTTAQAKALGLLADSLVTSDGTVTLGAGYTYDYDPSNGVTAGAYDIVGVMMHEISEVMGRIGISGGTVTPGPIPHSYTLLDLFSYTGAGTRSVTPGGSFSIDNGTTLLKAFNTVAGGDTRDWASGSNDSFNAFSSSGVVNPLTSVGVRSVDVIGYDLIGSATATPEPASLVLFAIGAACIGIRARRRGTVA